MISLNISNALNDLGQFIIDNNILSLMIATTVGFAFSNVVKSFKTNIIDYHIINLLHLGKSNSNLVIFLTTILEFLFMLLIIYNIYKFLFIKIINKYQHDKINTSIIQKSIADSLLQIEKNTTPTVAATPTPTPTSAFAS